MFVQAADCVNLQKTNKQTRLKIQWAKTMHTLSSRNGGKEDDGPMCVCKFTLGM